VLRDRGAEPTPGQLDSVRAFSWWLSNRFPTPDTIPDLARAWNEFLCDPSERIYVVWHTPPYSTVRRTDPLPTRTFAAAWHRAEEYLAAGETAGIKAIHPTASATSDIVASSSTRQRARSSHGAPRAGLGSSAETAINPFTRVERLRSMLAAAGIIIPGTISLLYATLVILAIVLPEH
jgi:hypothetical protein